MMLLRRVSAVVALIVLLSPAGAGAQTPPIRVLVTNDDGYEAPGLRIMRDALIAAGFQVTVSAPAGDSSGAGASMTSGVLKVEDHGKGVYAVHGTPADSALVGLLQILKDAPPDIVVSGTNRGQNLGATTNSSGTVGAAVVAATYGYPAIAVSAGIGADAANVTRAYELAADLVRQVVAALSASRPAGGKLLPPRLVININQPALAADRLKGIRVAPLSKRGGFTRVIESGNPGEVRARLTLTPVGDETGTDVALFAEGYTTVTVLDGDWSVDAGAAAAVLDRLAKVALRKP
jgi:5'-nucleotidase